MSVSEYLLQPCLLTASSIHMALGQHNYTQFRLCVKGEILCCFFIYVCMCVGVCCLTDPAWYALSAWVCVIKQTKPPPWCVFVIQSHTRKHARTHTHARFHTCTDRQTDRHSHTHTHTSHAHTVHQFSWCGVMSIVCLSCQFVMRLTLWFCENC